MQHTPNTKIRKPIVVGVQCLRHLQFPVVNMCRAHAQLAGQVAATREAEARVEQAISRWEREKVDRLRFRKEYITKCSEAQVLLFVFSTLVWMHVCRNKKA